MNDCNQNKGDGLYKNKYHIQRIKMVQNPRFKNLSYRPYNNPKHVDKREFIEKLVPVDADAEYFVLRLDNGGKDPEHIKACRIGVHAYADAISHHLPQLAIDLKDKYPLL